MPIMNRPKTHSSRPSASCPIGSAISQGQQPKPLGAPGRIGQIGRIFPFHLLARARGVSSEKSAPSVRSVRAIQRSPGHGKNIGFYEAQLWRHCLVACKSAKVLGYAVWKTFIQRNGLDQIRPIRHFDRR